MAAPCLGNAQAPRGNARSRLLKHLWVSRAACAALPFRVQPLSSSSAPALPGVGAEMQKSTHELIEVVTSSPAAFPTLAKFDLKLIS